PLRAQFVADEPPVRAQRVLLEGGGAEQPDLPHPPEHGLELERTRPEPAVLQPRSRGGLRPGELAIPRRRAEIEDRFGDSAGARPPPSGTIPLARSSRSSGRRGTSSGRT